MGNGKTFICMFLASLLLVKKVPSFIVTVSQDLKKQFMKVWTLFRVGLPHLDYNTVVVCTPVEFYNYKLPNSYGLIIDEADAFAKTYALRI